MSKITKKESEDTLKEIKNIYKVIKSEICKRLEEFKGIWLTGSDLDIFIELIFCVLTPQSNAKSCWKAVKILKEKNLILNGTPEELSEVLNIVRFKHNKAKYIIFLRKLFTKQNHCYIKITLNNLNMFNDILIFREWLVKNIKGIGFKEASHFLRNIGFGDDIAILDRHILRNLKLLEVIDEIPKTLTKKQYILIENKMREFAKKINIPLSHLDIVLWYKETGEIFK